MGSKQTHGHVSKFFSPCFILRFLPRQTELAGWEGREKVQKKTATSGQREIALLLQAKQVSEWNILQDVGPSYSCLSKE